MYIWGGGGDDQSFSTNLIRVRCSAGLGQGLGSEFYGEDIFNISL